MRNLIKYIGSKNLTLDIIFNKYPNLNIYCEPFSGSFYTGFITAEKFPNKKYIYNDIEESMYNFWVCAKTDIFELYDKIDEIYSILKNYNELDDQLNVLNKQMQINNMSRAAVTYIIHTNRKFKERTLELIEKSVDIKVDDLITYINLFEHVELFNKSYEDIIKQFDSENTLFLIDPPYYVKNVDSYYKSDCRFIHHRTISNVIKEIKGKFVITYNICDYIKGLYKDYPQVEIIKSFYTKDLIIHNMDLTEKEVNKIYNCIEIQWGIQWN